MLSICAGADEAEGWVLRVCGEDVRNPGRSGLLVQDFPSSQPTVSH